ncbi:cytochrome P450 [Streptomyces hainanensis]|uniref:Cytochrome P450 n=1 Tax=Streptomyces hainanensis TaxID=402648 RepID=A0A4R4SHM0_9ACTN|nr:cytochrome P450 [Streptomyces hainanensis]TDC62196.1 cytochrome P450 [Streptomyces hainanensis]
MEPHTTTTSELATLPAEPLMTRDYETRPALVYEQLRNRYGAVAPVDLYGVRVWLVVGYHEVMEVLRDESVWKADAAHWRALQEGRVPDDWPMLAGYRVDHLLHQDDERRRATRAAVEAALRPFQDPGRPQGVELRLTVERYADELIAVFTNGRSTGHVDLSTQFTRPLPLMMLNRLFGFPVEQGDDIVMDAWRMADSAPDAGAAIKRLIAAATDLARHKREHPGDDLTSHLIAAAPELAPEQIAIELYAIIVYSDYIGQTITNTVLEVLTGSDQAWQSLENGAYGELVNRVHMASPPWANLPLRYPVSDVVLGDRRIAAGDPVMPSVAAAHGDPLFAAALRDDSLKSSRAHLAWGAGVHQCPAQELAEMVATTAVSRLLDRCELELTLPADQIPWRLSPYARGVKSLPVRFRTLAGTSAWPPFPEASAPAGADAAPAPAPTSASEPRGRSRLWRFLSSLVSGQPGG